MGDSSQGADHWRTKLREAESHLNYTYREALQNIAGKLFENRQLQEFFDPARDRTGVGKLGEIANLLIAEETVTLDELYFAAPLLFRLCTMLPQPEQVYWMMNHILKDRDPHGRSKYVSVKILEYRALLSVFRAILRRLLPKHIGILLSIDALCDFYLHNIFVGLFFNIVREELAVKIVDSYLTEGEAVLLKVGYALIALCAPQIEEGRFQSAQDFWAYVLQASDSVNFDELLAIAIGTTAGNTIGSPFLKKLSNNNSMYFSTKTLHGLKRDAERLLPPIGNEDYDAYLVGVSLLATTKSKFDYSMLLQSLLLTPSEAVRLSSYMRQVRASPSSFRLVYRSKTHGARLRTMLESTGLRWPCIMLMRAAKSKVVFGAYLTCPICPPNNLVRGDRGCFVFSLSGADANRYFAVGLQNEKQGNNKKKKARRYYCKVRPFELSIGCGFDNQSRTHAIMLTEELKVAFCGPSLTYANPPLAINEDIPILAVSENHMHAVPIDLIEVFVGDNIADLRELYNELNISSNSSSSSWNEDIAYMYGQLSELENVDAFYQDQRLQRDLDADDDDDEEDSQEGFDNVDVGYGDDFEDLGGGIGEEDDDDDEDEEYDGEDEAGIPLDHRMQLVFASRSHGHNQVNINEAEEEEEVDDEDYYDEEEEGDYDDEGDEEGEYDDEDYEEQGDYSESADAELREDADVEEEEEADEDEEEEEGTVGNYQEHQGKNTTVSHVEVIQFSKSNRYQSSIDGNETADSDYGELQSDTETESIVDLETEADDALPNSNVIAKQLLEKDDDTTLVSESHALQVEMLYPPVTAAAEDVENGLDQQQQPLQQEQQEQVIAIEKPAAIVYLEIATADNELKRVALESATRALDNSSIIARTDVGCLELLIEDKDTAQEDISEQLQQVIPLDAEAEPPCVFVGGAEEPIQEQHVLETDAALPTVDATLIESVRQDSEAVAEGAIVEQEDPNIFGMDLKEILEVLTAEVDVVAEADFANAKSVGFPVSRDDDDDNGEGNNDDQQSVDTTSTQDFVRDVVNTSEVTFDDEIAIQDVEVSLVSNDESVLDISITSADLDFDMSHASSIPKQAPSGAAQSRQQLGGSSSTSSSNSSSVRPNAQFHPHYQLFHHHSHQPHDTERHAEVVPVRASTIRTQHPEVVSTLQYYDNFGKSSGSLVSDQSQSPVATLYSQSRLRKTKKTRGSIAADFAAKEYMAELSRITSSTAAYEYVSQKKEVGTVADASTMTPASAAATPSDAKSPAVSVVELARRIQKEAELRAKNSALTSPVGTPSKQTRKLLTPTVSHSPSAATSPAGGSRGHFPVGYPHAVSTPTSASQLALKAIAGARNLAPTASKTPFSASPVVTATASISAQRDDSMSLNYTGDSTSDVVANEDAKEASLSESNSHQPIVVSPVRGSSAVELALQLVQRAKSSRNLVSGVDANSNSGANLDVSASDALQ